ncbi:MAG: HNH endonuclease [Paraclostridium sp.]
MKHLKDVVEFGENYYITTCGRVFSKKYGDLRELKRNKSKNGYLCVTFSSNKKTYKSYKVHRLVMFAYSNIINTKKLVVNHIDENKENNSIVNLEWCTQKYNLSHSNICVNRPDQSKKVIQLSVDGEIINEFLSAADIKRIHGFDDSLIRKCCNGKTKSAYGYKWKFKEA